jgi:hypothetical protein
MSRIDHTLEILAPYIVMKLALTLNKSQFLAKFFVPDRDSDSLAY